MRLLTKARGGRIGNIGNVKVAEKSSHVITSPSEIF
jgi:hypothetical protein